jgi:hypothetical protein
MIIYPPEGDQAVGMDMIFEVGAKGMEYTDHARQATYIFRVSSKNLYGLPCSSHEQGIDDIFIGSGQCVQLVGKGKDHVDVGSVE